MSREKHRRPLHHDLRGALSTVQMNLETLEVLEEGESDVTPEKRLAIVQRAKAALSQAVELADRMKAEDSGSAASRS